ncbi:MAG: hypothetical protein GKR97_05765 [Rhizobiaceae bacterium]|nr:hypothetical protein [Rhizobiaceae bacterium]
MGDFAPALGLLIIAAITPGPNNLFVLNSAMRGGLAAAARTIGAITLGSVFLFAMVKLGLDAMVNMVPMSRPIMGFLGALYLGWLGINMLRADQEKPAVNTRIPHHSHVGLTLFQLLNPKGWILMSVYVTAAGQTQITTLLIVLLLVMSACLSAWAVLGMFLSKIVTTQLPYFCCH